MSVKNYKSGGFWFFLALILAPLISFANERCEEVVSKELTKLNMGTFKRPSLGTTKVRPSRETGEDVRFVLGNQKVSLRYQRPGDNSYATIFESINGFIADQSKVIYLNEECEIKSIDITFPGTPESPDYVLSATNCKNVNAGSNAVKDKIEDMCKEYNTAFAQPQKTSPQVKPSSGTAGVK